MSGLAQWHDWINTGALAAFSMFVCVLVYKMLMHGGKKALEIGERYVRSTEELHGTLKDVESHRNELCNRHATGLEDVTTQVAESNNHLKRLVEIHEQPGGDVKESINATHRAAEDVARMKRAAIRACEMCRRVAKTEMPDSSDEVGRHCDEIERIIGGE